MMVPDKDVQAAATPEAVLRMLREGNYRFTNNLRASRNPLQEVVVSRDGQYPLAVIVNCIDSRTPAEALFDQGLGQFFVIRLAGSVISTEVLGSIEFATKLAGAKLVVVLGHSGCGAIKGACDDVRMGNLTELLAGIRPAVEAETTITSGRDSSNVEFVDKVSEIHVRRSLDAVVERSEVLRELIAQGQVGLIGGMYQIETGVVDFYDDTFLLANRAIRDFMSRHRNSKQPPDLLA